MERQRLAPPDNLGVRAGVRAAQTVISYKTSKSHNIDTKNTVDIKKQERLALALQTWD